jgi:hypothetical protein
MAKLGLFQVSLASHGLFPLSDPVCLKYCLRSHYGYEALSTGLVVHSINPAHEDNSLFYMSDARNNLQSQ